MSKTEYTIVRGDTFRIFDGEHFIKEVNQMLADGWECQGGLAPYDKGERSGEVLQAMIRIID